MPEPLTFPSFESDGDLLAVGAQLRAEWREDEYVWMGEAARRWAHGRRIGDVLREYAARGDRISVDVAGRTFGGVVAAVGDDRLDVTTVSAVVTVRTALSGAFGALAAPVLIRRLHRARAGGRRVPSALVTFVARLRELEEAGLPVRIGTFLGHHELTGTVVVGADHVRVRQDDDVIVPSAWVAYVAVASEGAA